VEEEEEGASTTNNVSKRPLRAFRRENKCYVYSIRSIDIQEHLKEKNE